MRLFSTRLSRPISYALKKVLRLHLNAVLTPPRMPRTPDVLQPPRVESLAEWRPLFERAPGRPAAIKRNGGLRGSTATKWG